jgi:hypothetical protein
MAAGKNTVTRAQVTQESVLLLTRCYPRPPDRIRYQQKSSRIATAGGFTPETNRRKKRKTNNALAARNATGNGAAIKDIETHRMPPAHPPLLREVIRVGTRYRSRLYVWGCVRTHYPTQKVPETGNLEVGR